jgi:hypothetical protein
MTYDPHNGRRHPNVQLVLYVIRLRKWFEERKSNILGCEFCHTDMCVISDLESMRQNEYRKHTSCSQQTPHVRLAAVYAEQ